MTGYPWQTWLLLALLVLGVVLIGHQRRRWHRLADRLAVALTPGAPRPGAQTGSTSPEAPPEVVARLEAIESALASLESRLLPRSTREARTGPCGSLHPSILHVRCALGAGHPPPHLGPTITGNVTWDTPVRVPRCPATQEGLPCERPQGHTGRHQTSIPATRTLGPGGYPSGPASPRPPRPPASTGPGAPPSTLGGIPVTPDPTVAPGTFRLEPTGLALGLVGAPGEPLVLSGDIGHMVGRCPDCQQRTGQPHTPDCHYLAPPAPPARLGDALRIRTAVRGPEQPWAHPEHPEPQTTQPGAQTGSGTQEDPVGGDPGDPGGPHAPCTPGVCHPWLTGTATDPCPVSLAAPFPLNTPPVPPPASA